MLNKNDNFYYYFCLITLRLYSLDAEFLFNKCCCVGFGHICFKAYYFNLLLVE